MNTMAKKVYADLTCNKAKTFSIILTLFIGMMSVGIVVMFNSRFVPDVTSCYYNAEPYDALIKTDAYDLSILDELLVIPGIEDADGRGVITVRLKTRGKIINTNLITLSQKNSINILHGQNGQSAFEVPKENEILLERATLTDINQIPGDYITVVGNGNEEFDLLVRDIVYDAVTEPYALEGDAVAYVNSDTISKITGDGRYTEIMLKLIGDGSKEENSKLANAAADYLRSKGINVHEIEVPTPGEFYATQALDAISIIIIIIGTLAILLGITLIINIFNSLMIQHISQIGIMKAIGGSTAQISIMYFGFVFVIGIVSFIISLPLSAFVAYVICELLAGILNMQLSGFRIPAELIVIQLICSVVLPLMATAVPILKVTGYSVYDALNDNIKGCSFKRIGILDILSRRFPKTPVIVLTSLRNCFRSKLRVTLTMFSLVLSGTVLVSALNLQKSFRNSIEDAKFLVPDGVLTLDTYQNATTLENLAAEIDGVEAVEGWAFSQARFIDKETGTSKKVRIMGPKSDSAIFDMEKAENKLISGRLIDDASTNEIVVTNHLTDYYPDICVGDILTLKINNQECEMKVVGIMGIFGRPSDPVLIGGYEFLNCRYEGKDMVNDLRFITSVSSEEYQNRVADDIEKELAKGGIYVKERNLGEAMLEEFTTSSSITVILLIFLSGMTALVGIIGLSGMLSLNILERAREIGIMRLIGGNNRLLNALIISEGTILILIAWGIGLISSLPLTAITGYLLGEALFATPLTLCVNCIGIVIWLAVSILASFISGIFPCVKMNRMVTRDVLSSL